MKASLDARDPAKASDVPTELPVLVYTLDGVLLSIAIATLFAVALLAVRERIHDFGVLRTVGFTPHQVSSSLVGAHAALAMIAAVISIPLGVGLFSSVYALAGGDRKDLVVARWWWLGLLPLAAAGVVIIATGLPARHSARTPITSSLRYE
jgi:putative ABC transport system permease protein